MAMVRDSDGGMAVAGRLDNLEAGLKQERAKRSAPREKW